MNDLAQRLRATAARLQEALNNPRTRWPNVHASDVVELLRSIADELDPPRDTSAPDDTANPEDPAP